MARFFVFFLLFAVWTFIFGILLHSSTQQDGGQWFVLPANKQASNAIREEWRKIRLWSLATSFLFCSVPAITGPAGGGRFVTLHFLSFSRKYFSQQQNGANHSPGLRQIFPFWLHQMEMIRSGKCIGLARTGNEQCVCVGGEAETQRKEKTLRRRGHLATPSHPVGPVPARVVSADPRTGEIAGKK